MKTVLNHEKGEFSAERSLVLSSSRRMNLISQHIQTTISEDCEGPENIALHLSANLCSNRLKQVSHIDPLMSLSLLEYMAGDYKDEKEKVYCFFSKHPELVTPVEVSKDVHRQLALQQMVGLVRDGEVRPLRALVNDPAKYFAITEAVGHMDLSLAIKLGVQFSLWGGSVLNLGTRKHRDKYFAGIDSVEYPGCFAMTELHHGSNVQGIQTTATYDLQSEEFLINTPNEGATKWWIGNAACHGKFATVFARLLLPSTSQSSLIEDMGVHAFIVPLRSMETHEVLPGVEIRDCGYKVGLNGVDNGALKFNNVRIPRDNLLNRFGDVSRDGNYSSDLPTVNKRFAATLGELVGGRVGLASGSVAVLKTATTIAVRYSLIRRQFGPPNEPEIAILDYQSQQQKLMPMLASCYGFHFATQCLVKKYAEMKKTHDEGLVADVHALSAGLKAYVTSYTQKAISVCRESCGGHGYAAVNRFGALRNDHDIFQTFEGDNTVLLQQVAGDLLKHYKAKFSNPVAATWIYLRDAMGTYINQKNPVTTHRENQNHLRDPQFQLDAFRYRTAKLLHTAALRLQKHTKKIGSFGAWNRCLNHLLTLADSHIESVVLVKFIEAYQRCPDQSTQKALKLLCDLYALERIWKDIGTYRNEDYVAPNKAKAIHKQVEILCREARDLAPGYILGFGIPDDLIKAPIGLQSGQYHEYAHQVGW